MGFIPKYALIHLYRHCCQTTTVTCDKRSPRDWSVRGSVQAAKPGHTLWLQIVTFVLQILYVWEADKKRWG